MKLREGDPAPAFKGITAEGVIARKDLEGAPAVLYFYPKDDTPGCTREACAFRDMLPRFKKTGARVFGVSKDKLEAHKKFAEKYELPFTLISDADGSICDAFGVWGEKSLYGRKYMGIERATFLMDADGMIRRIWRNVKVSGHAEEVLDAVKLINSKV
jgi:thioredoxin-dependent peroxiredoxin